MVELVAVTVTAGVTSEDRPQDETDQDYVARDGHGSTDLLGDVVPHYRIVGDEAFFSFRDVRVRQVTG